jgi:hypothetical protein
MALDLLTSKDDFNKFKTLLTKIKNLTDKKTKTTNIERILEQDKINVILDTIVKQTEKVIFKPHVKFIKNAKQIF